MQNYQLLVVPRWGGEPSNDWYPWLLQELKQRDLPQLGEVHVLDMPNPQLPVIGPWRDHLASVAGTDPEVLSRTLIMSHSAGCLAVLHYLATLPPQTQVAGALCVAGWFTIDDPWETIIPWTQDLPDFDSARASAPNLHLLLSDNDPFTSDHVTTGRLWQERVGANVTVAPGRKHFNQSVEPDVLDALLRLLQVQ